MSRNRDAIQHLNREPSTNFMKSFTVMKQRIYILQHGSRELKTFLAQAGPAQTTFLKDWDMIRDLDTGTFFLAHPIAGYSLWQFI